MSSKMAPQGRPHPPQAHERTTRHATLRRHVRQTPRERPVMRRRRSRSGRSRPAVWAVRDHSVKVPGRIRQGLVKTSWIPPRGPTSVGGPPPRRGAPSQGAGLRAKSKGSRAPRRPYERPEATHECPKTVQERPKMAQESIQTAPDRSKTLKMASRRPKTPLRRPKRPPRCVPRGSPDAEIANFHS